MKQSNENENRIKLENEICEIYLNDVAMWKKNLQMKELNNVLVCKQKKNLDNDEIMKNKSSKVTCSKVKWGPNFIMLKSLLC